VAALWASNAMLLLEDFHGKDTAPKVAQNLVCQQVPVQNFGGEKAAMRLDYLRCQHDLSCFLLVAFHNFLDVEHHICF
jgi:hypothetical protein